MSFSIAFDTEKNLTIFLSDEMIYENNCIYPKPFSRIKKLRTGYLLLQFLNTDFEDDNDCAAFIYEYCFKSFYLRKHPETKEKLNLIAFKLTKEQFYYELKDFVKKVKANFLYFKHTLLKILNLPYNNDFVDDDIEIEDEDFFNKNPKIKAYLQDIKEYLRKQRQEYENYKKEIDNIKQSSPLIYEKYFKKPTIEIKEDVPDNETEINSFITDISLDFDFGRFLVNGISLSKYNIPYCFYGDDIISIIALEFKVFKSSKHNIIRICQNCGDYFIPENLKETKYCAFIDESTGKLCREIGKELSYKKSLSSDKALDMYRKRYKSLATSVYNYDTDNAIKKFEKYKTEGAMMKAKYQNKEITSEEFIKWIFYSKSQEFLTE